ncbi:rod shape-determining protein MreD [Drancourtella sp. An210]|nr:rod shape-determining protein MreD [Drancourtella sp. An210]OUP64573.1 rod shape-determining protein MreD [Drancourtella sp. An177]
MGMQTVKRKAIEVIMIILFFLLETTVFQYLEIASIKPNLLVILTASFGFMRGKNEGMFVGFLSGFLLDLCFSRYIGFYTLLYSVIGYVNGFFKRLYYSDDMKLPLLLISGSELIYGLWVYVFQFMLQSDFHFLYYLGHIIMPELVYTILVTLILYQIILRINRRLEDEEKRSASKFV